MELPKKNTLKAAFVAAVAGLTLTGCAVVPYEPAYRHREPVIFVPQRPVIVVPEPRFEHHHPNYHPHRRNW